MSRYIRSRDQGAFRRAPAPPRRRGLPSKRRPPPLSLCLPSVLPPLLSLVCDQPPPPPHCLFLHPSLSHRRAYNGAADRRSGHVPVPSAPRPRRTPVALPSCPCLAQHIPYASCHGPIYIETRSLASKCPLPLAYLTRLLSLSLSPSLSFFLFLSLSYFCPSCLALSSQQTRLSFFLSLSPSYLCLSLLAADTSGCALPGTRRPLTWLP